MAHYTIALVQHGTSLSTEQLDNTCRELQAFYTAVFEGTSDRLTVQWRTGTSDHNIVIHFAQDVASSYLHERMPGRALGSGIAGHTRERNGKVCTEIYKNVLIRGTVRQPGPNAWARVAFHESMHNVEPDATEEQIGATEGLGATPIGRSLTDGNKEWIRTKIRTKRTQQL